MAEKGRSIELLTPTEKPVDIVPVQPKGSIKVAFWGLRIYIVVMLILVVIGFTRGMH